MNRHERRKQKKNNKFNTLNNNRLIEGIKHHTQRNFSKAQEIYNFVLSKEPNNYEAIRHLGILYYDTMRKEEAYNSFQAAIKLYPERCEAFNNLGFMHLENMNYKLAEKCFKESIKKKTDYIPALNNIVTLYLKIGEKINALSISEKAIQLDPKNQITQNQRAKALIANNKIENGIDILEKLCIQNPLPDFLLNLSTAYRELGNIVKADKIVVNEFKKNYKLESFFHLFAKIKGNKLKDEHINYYNSIIENDEKTKPALNRKVLLCESFFDYYRNLKEYKKSGKYLKLMNDIQYSLEEFSIKKEYDFFEKITFSQKNIIQLDHEDRPDDVTPIIICGMPRSGTTLCEQILSSHSDVTGAGELNYLAEVCGIKKLINTPEKNLDDFLENISDQQRLEEIRDLYLQSLIKHRKNGTKYICDKMPHNFILIGLIKSILPQAKIIYCKRDPIDNCFSLYSHKWIEMSHQYSYNQKILAEYYKLHEKLMKFWFNLIPDIFVLDNEILVQDQKKVTESLLNFCDLEWQKECLEFHKNIRQVRTASIEQVRKPINNKSIGAYKKYRSYLSDIIDSFQ